MKEMIIHVNKLGVPMPENYDMRSLADWAYPNVEVPQPGEHVAAVTWDITHPTKRFMEGVAVVEIVFRRTVSPGSVVNTGSTLAKIQGSMVAMRRQQLTLPITRFDDANAFCNELRPLIIARERLAGRLRSEDKVT